MNGQYLIVKFSEHILTKQIKLLIIRNVREILIKRAGCAVGIRLLSCATVEIHITVNRL